MSERSVREARGVGEESQIKNIYSLPIPYPVISPVLRSGVYYFSRDSIHAFNDQIKIGWPGFALSRNPDAIKYLVGNSLAD